MSIGAKIIDYFKTSKEELKKVSWPTKKETTHYSLIVVGLSLAVAVFFGVLDFIFNFGLEKMISLR
ncbi:MAG: preprotein translocase subunit SecE [Candidatus Magasanikbacteria bacterium]|nr:preprotein translocase subunit SecE [Candidatus Magasanikbacteria bacterium]